MSEAADRPTVLHHIRNDVHKVAAIVHLSPLGFRMPRIAVQRAEIAAEGHKPVVGQVLVAKAQHEVLHPRLVDRTEIARRQRFGQIDAGNIGAQSSFGGDDVQHFGSLPKGILLPASKARVGRNR